jgi:hypothetical protein
MSLPTYKEWLASRVPLAQALAKEFPFQQKLSVWVVGWTNDGMVLLTAINPTLDYEGAIRHQVEWPAAQLRSLLPPIKQRRVTRRELSS